MAPRTLCSLFSPRSPTCSGSSITAPPPAAAATISPRTIFPPFQPLPQPYLDCLDAGTGYAACTASGRLIEDGGAHGARAGPRGALTCRTCRHACLERAAESLAHCPLCHAPFDAGFTGRAR